MAPVEQRRGSSALAARFDLLSIYGYVFSSTKLRAKRSQLRSFCFSAGGLLARERINFDHLIFACARGFDAVGSLIALVERKKMRYYCNSR